MSGGKTSGKTYGKQAAQYAGKQPDEGSAVTRRDTTAPENEEHASGRTHRKSTRLKEMSAAKEAGGKGETEKGNQSASQQKRARNTTRKATQTQPFLLAADAFVAALGAVPAEDWCMTWAAGRTIMLRRTSKKVREVVDKMRLPAVVRLSRSFWDDARNGTGEAKLEFVWRQLAAMTARCLITTLALPKCEMKGQDQERLAGVLAQCPALAHLDLSGNSGFGAGGADRLAGVLGQCWELVHLNLWGNKIVAGGNSIGPGGADRLAGVLPQCAALAHLNLWGNSIGPEGAESFAGALGQCPALAHLNLRYKSDRRCWDREACKSAAAVHSASPPQSQLESDPSRRGREPCRSACTVRSAGSPPSLRQ
jgi:hypothetical protein